jgi:hypothetical protein
LALDLLAANFIHYYSKAFNAACLFTLIEPRIVISLHEYYLCVYRMGNKGICALSLERNPEQAVKSLLKPDEKTCVSLEEVNNSDP